MTTFLQDLRYAARGLRQAPGFTLVAALTLALGIGANAAMFGVVDALLFRPPAHVADPGRVVRVQLQLPPLPNEPAAELSSVLSYPDYVNLRDNTRRFSGVAAFAPSALTVGEGEDARTQDALLVTGDYFQVLGARPARGRFIAPDDDRDGAPNPVVVLSWDFWRRTFPGDSGSLALGKTLVINGRAFNVIGVAPRHFVGTQLGTPALWIPLGNGAALGQNAQMMRSRFVSWLSVVARLAPGATREQARTAAQAAILAARDEAGELPTPGQLGEGMPMGGGEVRVQIGGAPGAGGAPRAAPPPPGVRLSGLGGAGSADLGTPFGRGRSLDISLWFLAITAAVLLIACANIANLMLARATRRSHEIAVRLSLGATRKQLAAQLMTESLLLALLGAAAGLWLAVVAVGLLPRVVPLPPLPPFLDARVLTFTALLTVGTTVAFGLVPALRATRPDIRSALGTGSTPGAGRSLGRRALVVVQLAASLVLLIGAGLFIRSLRNVKRIERRVRRRASAGGEGAGTRDACAEGADGGVLAARAGTCARRARRQRRGARDGRSVPDEHHAAGGCARLPVPRRAAARGPDGLRRRRLLRDAPHPDHPGSPIHRGGPRWRGAGGDRQRGDGSPDLGRPIPARQMHPHGDDRPGRAVRRGGRRRREREIRRHHRPSRTPSSTGRSRSALVRRRP